MNLGAELWLRERGKDIDEHGDNYRKHVLEHLRLKTVLKEYHCSPVTSLASYAAGGQHLVASVGHNQVTVYDGNNLGEHIGIVVQYANRPTDDSPAKQLRAVCWLGTCGVGGAGNGTLAGDIYLAVGGEDRTVSLISLAQARVVHLLDGHSASIKCIAAFVDAHSLNNSAAKLAVLTADSMVTLWSLADLQRTWSVKIPNAQALAWAPNGVQIIVSTSRGKVWVADIQDPDPVETSLPITMDTRTGPGCIIDCMMSLPGNRLAIKAPDGRMAILDWPKRALQSSWRVKGGTAPGSKFGATPDGQVIVVGNTRGHAFAYCSETGALLAHLEPQRLHEPVLAATISPDCRHLWTAIGHGFIVRYEFLGVIADDATQAKKEAAGD